MVARWAPGELDALVAAGVLKTGTASGTVICDGCDEACQEDVEFVEVEDDDGKLRAYVICHSRDLGRVRVSLDSLESWRPSAGALARWIAGQLRVNTTPEECVADRLWWIGRPHLGHRRADLFLARGSAWADAGGVFGKAPRLSECARPMVLVPWEVPKSSPFLPEAAVVSLGRLLQLGDGPLSLDASGIAEASGGRRAAGLRAVAPFPTPPGAAWEQVVIKAVSDEDVVISVGGIQEPKTFTDLGFADGRSGKPNAAWSLLLVMARQDGSISWDDPVAQGKLLKRKKLVSDLRRSLKAAFGITSDPIPYNRKTHAYEVKFIILDRRRTSR